MGNILEPQCGQGGLLGDGEASLGSRYQTDMFPRKLGEGQFSKAYVCWNKNKSSQCYALKVFVAASEGADHATNEIRVLHALGQHPRIIRLIDVDNQDPRNMRLVLELCEGGQLFDRLVSLGRYKEAKAACVAQEILEAVAYMHGKGIMHRDLKPENILMVSPDSDINIKVCDFGVAKMVDPLDKIVIPDQVIQRWRMKPPPRATSFKGSDFYLTPEMIRQEEYGPEIDIWALGVTTYSLICGSLPFVGDDGVEDLRGTYRKIVNREIHFEGEAWDEASSMVRDFILQMLCIDPSQRLTARKALEHNWVKAADFSESDDDVEDVDDADDVDDDRSDRSDRSDSSLVIDELDDEGGPPCVSYSF